MVITGIALERPDKTGHFRKLLGFGAWVGVSDTMVAESIMMVCFLLVCQDGGIVLTDALVVGQSTLDGLVCRSGRNHARGRKPLPLFLSAL